jgi:uncharacterized protein (UPF0335 family)
MADIGDNSGMLSSDGAAQVKALAVRIISLLDDRDEVNEDIREVFKEAKEAGLDSKIMRKAVAEERKDQIALKAERDMVDMYRMAISGKLLDLLDGDIQPTSRKAKAAPVATLDDEPAAPDEPTADETALAEAE